MSGILLGETEPDPEEEELEEETDPLIEAFIRGDQVIILHKMACNYLTSNGMSRCNCVPKTLRRGAVA